MRRGLAVVAFAVAGCAPPPTDRPASELKVTGFETPEALAWLKQVQAQACFRPTVAARCTPGMRVTFAGPDATSADGHRRSGTMWCDAEGRPRGRFEGFSPDEPIEGPIPLPVWESLWRVLVVSSSRAAFDGQPIRVTRGDGPPSSTTPGFEVRSIIESAAAAASRGPPPEVPSNALDSICSIDPTACPRVEYEQVCPPFTGDLWNGLRTPSPARTIDLDGESEPPGDSRSSDPPSSDPEPAADPARLPSQGEVTRALSAAVPSARRCLPPDVVVRASIVFASSGLVQSVTVQPVGPPAYAACIERALGAVRLRPFAEPSYAVALTVRR